MSGVADTGDVSTGARFTRASVGLVVASLALACLSGCDRSMTGETFDVAVVNDTASSLWVAQCSNDGGGPPCDMTEPPEEVRPGETVRAGTSVNVPNPWTIRHAQTSAVIGCVDLLFTTYPTGDRSPKVSLSTASQAQCSG